MTEQAELILYSYGWCPYCHKVLKAIQELGISDRIEVRDLDEDQKHLRALLTATGGTQAPCLMIAGKPMLESADIVAYLRKRFGRGAVGPA